MIAADGRVAPPSAGGVPTAGWATTARERHVCDARKYARRAVERRALRRTERPDHPLTRYRYWAAAGVREEQSLGTRAVQRG